MSEKIKLNSLSNLVSTGFGIGLGPFMPGTYGTAIMLLPIYFSIGLSTKLLILISLILIILGLWSSNETIRNLTAKDHPSIVIDEMAGFYLVVFTINDNLAALIIAFIIFRMLDIVKPWPISYVDRECKGAIGIMADDLMAGAATALLMPVLIKLFNLL
jgi:phosphatidylglycerophosphatase A